MDKLIETAEKKYGRRFTDAEKQRIRESNWESVRALLATKYVIEDP